MPDKNGHFVPNSGLPDFKEAPSSTVTPIDPKKVKVRDRLVKDFSASLTELLGKDFETDVRFEKVVEAVAGGRSPISVFADMRGG